jgi:hypothetical protein
MKKALFSFILGSALFAANAFAATHVPPGAKDLDASDPMKVGIDAAKQQLAQQAGTKAKVDAYVLPAGTTFEKVTEFYKTQLTGWKEQAKVAQPTGGSATWTNDKNEVLSISFMTNAMNPAGAPYLIIAEAQPAH